MLTLYSCTPFDRKEFNECAVVAENVGVRQIVWVDVNDRHSLRPDPDTLNGNSCAVLPRCTNMTAPCNPVGSFCILSQGTCHRVSATRHCGPLRLGHRHPRRCRRRGRAAASPAKSSRAMACTWHPAEINARAVSMTHFDHYKTQQ